MSLKMLLTKIFYNNLFIKNLIKTTLLIILLFLPQPDLAQINFVEYYFDGQGVTNGLNGAYSVTVSPDGKYLYAAGYDDNAVAVFSRDATTGSLTYVEKQQDGAGGVVDGLFDVVSVTVSPDGKYLYAAGMSDNAVAVFSRDATTGRLTYVEVQRNGGGVNGLSGASSVTVSPDGKHLYAAGYLDDAVAVFSRDATTGRLTYVEMQKDGDGSVDGLSGTRSVILSPDGKHLYAAGQNDNAVAVFSRDATTGSLTYIEMQKDGDGSVDGLSNVYSVTVSPDGKHLYTAGIGDDAVAVFSRDATTGRLTYVEMQQNGGGVNGLSGAFSVTVSPDGEHLYAAGYNDNAVAVFSRDATTGRLTYVEMQQDGAGGVDGLSGARSVTLSPDGKHLYAAGYNDDAVAVFSRHATTGSLTYVEMQKNGFGGVNGLSGASSVTVSPDGKHLYASGYNDNAVAVFSRDATTGSLTYIEMQQDGFWGVDGLYGAMSVTLSPDGKHIYAAGTGDDAVAVFSRDATTGRLTYVEMQKDGDGGVDGLYGAASVTVSPDGKHLYAAGMSDNAVAVFSRDETTGRLTYVEVQRNGGGVNGLSGASSVTVSPDGKHLYASGYNDNAVAVFSRDATTGSLTYIEMQQDDVGGVDGLNGAMSVTLSPDGKHIYAAGSGDDAVAVFSRDATTGRLTYVEMQQDGLGGVNGLGGAYSVTLSPDGKHLYAAGYNDNAVAVFSRDATTGRLTYVEMQQNGGGVDGLNGAMSVTLSPDGKHLYTAGTVDNAVVLFEVAVPAVVEPVNPAPFVVTNTGGSVDEGGTFTFNDLNLKAGDADGPSYSLIYNVTQSPVHGSLAKSGALMKGDGTETFSFTQNDIANGKVSYTHNGEESNEDFFKFTISDSDGNTSDEYTFTITINGVNDPPTVGTLASITMQEDEEYTLDLTGWYDVIEDIDNADSTLTFSLSCDNGGISFSEIVDYACTISSGPNYFGTDSITVSISDGESTCVCKVALIIESVNDLPVINGLPTSLSITNGDVETMELNGQATDVETPDSLLTWSFVASPDSVNISYNASTKVVSLSAKGSFESTAELTVTVTDADGGTDETTIEITVLADPTGIEGQNGLPTEYTLYQNYPNPFNPSTVIRYGIPADAEPALSANRLVEVSANVTLRIYDILGNEVATLVNGQQSPGYYERTWNAGKVSSGIGCASGVYFYVLRAGSYVQSKKMLLLK